MIISNKDAFRSIITVSLFSLQRKFFLKWKARATMKARTSALHHQTVWTTVAPRTWLNSPQQTWRTWRSITISGKIQAATPHLEALMDTRRCAFPFSLFFFLFFFVFSFVSWRKLQIFFLGFGETLGKLFLFCLDLLPKEQIRLRRGESRTSKTEALHIRCLNRDTETVGECLELLLKNY